MYGQPLMEGVIAGLFVNHSVIICKPFGTESIMSRFIPYYIVIGEEI